MCRTTFRSLSLMECSSRVFLMTSSVPEPFSLRTMGKEVSSRSEISSGQMVSEEVVRTSSSFAKVLYLRPDACRLPSTNPRSIRFSEMAFSIASVLPVTRLTSTCGNLDLNPARIGAISHWAIVVLAPSLSLPPTEPLSILISLSSFL